MADPLYKEYDTEAAAIADRDLLDKEYVKAGGKLPETAADLRIGKHCTVPIERMLRTHVVDIMRHPDSNVQRWAIGVTPFVAAQDGKVDALTGHALDLSSATKLPDDWDVEKAAVAPVETLKEK